MNDRETNPPLGFKSIASIFHASSRDTNSVRVERQLAVIGNAVGHTVGLGQGQWMVSGQTTDTPSLKISFALALRSDDKSKGSPGKRNNHQLCLPY